MIQYSLKKTLNLISKFLFTLLFLASLSPSVFAIGTFISAPGRVDMAFDQLRKILYITSGSSLLRYDLTTNSFLSPVEFSGSLKGIDISPDFKTLAIANRNLYGIHLIDLTTNQPRRVAYKPGMERGSFAVAFGDNNTILVSASVDDDAWVPLRKYDLSTNTFSKLGEVRQDTMLSASADGKFIGFAESNDSGGSFGRYDLGKNRIDHKKGYDEGTGGFNFEIAVNRNGTQYVVLTGLGDLFDSNLKKFAKIHEGMNGPAGAAYSPAKDILYLPWTNTSEIYAYDTNTFQKIAAYDVESTFQLNTLWPFANNGRIKVSRDGKYLFVTVPDGIKYIDLTVADNNNKLISADSTVRMLNK